VVAHFRTNRPTFWLNTPWPTRSLSSSGSCRSRSRHRPYRLPRPVLAATAARLHSTVCLPLSSPRNGSRVASPRFLSIEIIESKSPLTGRQLLFLGRSSPHLSGTIKSVVSTASTPCFHSRLKFRKSSLQSTTTTSSAPPPFVPFRH
jgi:hypothetical protein